MPVAEIVSLIPVTELLKLVRAKKVKDFKPLFKELVSTMQTLVPVIQEIDMLQKRVDPSNKDLIINSLTETLRRAENMARKCSRVREYDVLKKSSYTEKIKGINQDFLKLCQIYLPLIHLRDTLRSRSLKLEESNPRFEHNSNVFTRDEDDEQRVILESFKDKGKGKQAKDQEDGQLAAALRESLNMQELDHSAGQKISFRRRQQEQQVILESWKDKGKGKQLQEQDEQVATAIQESLNMEELLVSQAIQESMYLLRQQEEQVAKRRARELEKDEQIANALLYDESERINNGSSSSTRAPLDKDDDVQRILWESFKNKRQ